MLYSLMMIYFLDEDFGNVTFFDNEMGMLCVDLDKNIFDDVDFYENDPETIVHVRILTSCSKFEKRKAYKNYIKISIKFKSGKS